MVTPTREHKTARMARSQFKVTSLGFKWLWLWRPSTPLPALTVLTACEGSKCPLLGLNQLNDWCKTCCLLCSCRRFPERLLSLHFTYGILSNVCPIWLTNNGDAIKMKRSQAGSLSLIFIDQRVLEKKNCVGDGFCYTIRTTITGPHRWWQPPATSHTVGTFPERMRSLPFYVCFQLFLILPSEVTPVALSCIWYGFILEPFQLIIHLLK